MRPKPAKTRKRSAAIVPPAVAARPHQISESAIRKPGLEIGDRVPTDYGSVVAGMVALLEQSRRASARAVNALMTATYWEIGRRIVEFEQKGERRAEYGERLLSRLATDLTERFGRGFSRYNLQFMRQFYLAFPPARICETVSRKLGSEKCETVSPKSETGQAHPPAGRLTKRNIFQTLSENSTASRIPQTLSAESGLASLRDLADCFPLPWSHYVLLVSRSRSPEAMAFYHTEALRGGWSVRQLQRQIGTQFYERTALSRNKAAMLTKGAQPKPEDAVSADEEIRGPLILEFLNLKDEYSESDLEEALIRHLETFLLELGGDFAFVGRQRRLRIDDTWYRVDLVFFHRVLRCLVVLDLKLDKLTPGDIGQMHVYCNYAKAHWTHPGENPPVGIILCAAQGDTLARYATEGLPNKTLVREYLTALPDEQLLADEIAKTRRMLEARK